MQAFHNNPDLKAAVLGLLAQHREADRIVKGTYWREYEWDDDRERMVKFPEPKGCAVGCTLESIRKIEGLPSIDHQERSLYERYLGVPEEVAAIEDHIFEELPDDEAILWPERFITLIPVGADLSDVAERYENERSDDQREDVELFVQLLQGASVPTAP